MRIFDGWTGKAMTRDDDGQLNGPLRQAEAYWTALRQGSALPRRADLDPRGLADVLDRAFLLERQDEDAPRFRLTGQTLSDLAGIDLRGMPLFALFHRNAQTALVAPFADCFDMPAVVELALTAQGIDGRADVAARMILLPLLDEFGVVRRALGVLSVAGVPDRAPVRFHLRELTLRPLPAEAGSRRLRLSPATPTLPGRPDGLAEAPAPLAHAPYLRVVK